jgi:chromosome partitioning protein
MKKVVVTNQKGGGGKSTVAVNLAWHLSRKIPTLLLDADAQGSSSSWTTGWEGLEVMQVTNAPHLKKVLTTLGNGLIIVDCPPHDAELAATAIPGADLVVVPVSPSPLDLWSAGPVLGALVGKVPVLVVMNRVRTGTRAATMARETLVKMGVPVAKTALGNRMAYAEAALAHQPVALYAPKNLAAHETLSLAKEVGKLINLEVTHA